MKTLLLEVGTEELPPSEMPAVLPALAAGAERLLGEARLGFQAVHVYATPRRLAIVVEGLADDQLAQSVTVTGPPRKAATDAAGKPTKAAEGFARSQGVSVERLITIQTDRGDYLAVERHEPGLPAPDVLPALLERLALSLPFAKQMRWGEGDVRFSRPIRWIVALLDDAVLPVSIAGATADRLTHGHRFVRPQPIALVRPADYGPALLAASVIVDVTARRDAVRREVEAVASSAGYRAVVHAATLETVVHLVEYPAAVLGTFDDAYLDLPREVVETPIRRHQKCFTVERPDGTLAARFVAVSNMPGADPSEIRRGNERVIRARLADADFYFRQDLERRPEERLPLLKGMVFQERLGTLFEKTERVAALAEALSRLAPESVETLRRAALLAKSDLASGMVREFPELQGVIGEEYARRAGESPAVGQAIREHYLPRSADDELPTSAAGALLSVADRADTIVGCIGVGLTPTGSQDPYGLRRHAHAILMIALARRLGLSLTALVDRALELLASKVTEPVATTRERVHDLFRVRLATILAGRGLRPDVVEAVLSRGFDDPLQALKRAEALTTLMARTDWEPLVVTFKRTINILPSRPIGEVNAALFVDEAERALHAELTARAPRARQALAGEDYAGALTELSALRPVVDRFFEAVLVMDKDAAIQENRLALLKGLADLLLCVGDLRKIQAAS